MVLVYGCRVDVSGTYLAVSILASQINVNVAFGAQTQNCLLGWLLHSDFRDEREWCLLRKHFLFVNCERPAANPSPSPMPKTV